MNGFRLASVVVALFASGLWAQTPPPMPPSPPMSPLGQAQGAVMPPPPALDVVAATVNGRPIPEIAIYRALMQVPPANWNAARPSILNFLVENALVDQYLTQLKTEVPDEEVNVAIKEIQAEATARKEDLNAVLKKMHLSMDEFKKEIVTSLRWEKFATQQASDKNLKDFFDKNQVMFDGTQVHARHILIAHDGGAEAAKEKILALRKSIDDKVAAGMTVIPASADALTKEKTRGELLVKAFAEVAEKESSCPSKKNGGDVGAFPRVGSMVEPFARAAFALKPMQMTDPVVTQFGTHLILVTDVRPGRDVKFEDAKNIVKGVYIEQLREAIVERYRPVSKIEYTQKK